MRVGKIIGVVAALLVVLILGGIVFLATIDFNEYRPLIAEKAREATGRELVIGGDIKLDISLTPVLAVSDVSFANAAWGSRPNMVTVRRFEIEVEIMPLISGQVRVRRLVLEGADILLETDKKGRGNWLFKEPVAPAKAKDTAGAKPEAPAKPAAQAPAGADAGALTLPVINRVEVRDATLTYRDGASGEETKLVIESLEGSAADLDSPLLLKLAASYNAVPVGANIEIGSANALIAGAEVSVKVDARLAGAEVRIDGRASTRPGSQSAVSFEMAGKSIAGLGPLAGTKLPEVGPYQVSAQAVLGPDALVLSRLKARLGKSDLTGKARVTFSFPTHIEASLRSSMLDLDPFLTETEGGGKAAAKSEAGAKKRLFSAEPLPLEALHAVDADITIEALRIAARGIALQDLSLKAELRRGRLRLRRLGTTLSTGGRLKAEIDLNAREKPAKVKAVIDASKIDVGILLKALEITDLISGKADFEATLRGRGVSVRQIMAGLSGKTEFVMEGGRLDGEYAKIATADVLKSVSSWGEEGKDTEINCLVSRFHIDRGVALSTALLFDTTNMTVGGKGEIHLDDETIDLTLAPRAKNPSLMSFAVPVHVGGTLAEPSLAPDPAGVAKGVATGVAASALLGPLALALPLVTGSGGDKNPCVEALQKASTAGARPASGEAAKKEEDKTIFDETKDALGAVGKTIGDSLKGLFGN